MAIASNHDLQSAVVDSHSYVVNCHRIGHVDCLNSDLVNSQTIITWGSCIITEKNQLLPYSSYSHILWFYIMSVNHRTKRNAKFVITLSFFSTYFGGYIAWWKPLNNSCGMSVCCLSFGSDILLVPNRWVVYFDCLRNMNILDYIFGCTQFNKPDNKLDNKLDNL